MIIARILSSSIYSISDDLEINNNSKNKPYLKIWRHLYWAFTEKKGERGDTPLDRRALPSNDVYVMAYISRKFHCTNNHKRVLN